MEAIDILRLILKAGQSWVRGLMEYLEPQMPTEEAVEIKATNLATLVVWSDVNESADPMLIMLDDEAMTKLETTHEEMRSMDEVYINLDSNEEKVQRLDEICYANGDGDFTLTPWVIEQRLPQILGPITIVRCGFVF